MKKVKGTSIVKYYVSMFCVLRLLLLLILRRIIYSLYYCNVNNINCNNIFCNVVPQ